MQNHYLILSVVIIIILTTSPLFNRLHVNSSEVDNRIVNGTIIGIVKWKFEEFGLHITVMLFLLIMILIKFLHHRVHYISDYIPESLALILIGILFGLIIYNVFEKENIHTKNNVWKFTPLLFFIYLLPPIVLQSAYTIYNPTFWEYLGVVLLFAVFGTVLNFLIIGFMMYALWISDGFGPPELDFDLKGFLLFSSLIVAVDPVAVLAIFQDIGVELGLYYIVFGESLFNDAVTVVLYDIMDTFTGKKAVTGGEIIVGVVSFFTVSFGGLLVGVVFGIVTCLITRIKSRLNAFTLLLLAYFSYIMADCIGWSGIISMIGCGLIQAAYAFHNLDRSAVTVVRNLTRIVSDICESVIFLFFGIEVVSTKLIWHTGYILWALIWCLAARAIVIFTLTFFVNFFEISGTKISVTQQIVLIYGGLRGAVAFSLAVLISPNKLGQQGEYNRQLIVTTTIFIILFTTGLMGMTIKPLVRLLKIRMEIDKKLSQFDSLNDSILHCTLAGIESIIGYRGYNAMRDLFIRLDERYLRRFLQREPETHDQKMLKVYEKVTMKMHYASMCPSKTESILKHIPDTLKYKFISWNASTMSIPGAFNPLGSMSNLSMLHPTSTPPNLSGPTGGGAHPFKNKIFDSAGSSRRQQRTSHVSKSLHYPRKIKFIRGQKRQAHFDEVFFDIMKTRNRVLKHHLSSSGGSASASASRSHLQMPSKKFEIHVPVIREHSTENYSSDDEVIDSKNFKKFSLDKSSSS
ncbi:unnamed protein product [Trichobilharzia szidati]|nr:unnamed protein product [Trichobilharzia szidati]